VPIGPGNLRPAAEPKAANPIGDNATREAPVLQRCNLPVAVPAARGVRGPLVAAPRTSPIRS